MKICTLKRLIFGMDKWVLFLLLFFINAITLPNPLDSFAHLFSWTLFDIWLITVGLCLNESNVYGNQKGHLKSIFKICAFLIIPTSIFLSGLIELGVIRRFHPNESSTQILMSIVILILMTSLFYCFIYVSRIVSMQFKKEDETFESVAVTFILIMFFFVGLWFIQPKLNRIVSKRDL